MARKFSLKDNPIFQRLEIPKPTESGVQTVHEHLLEQSIESKAPSLPGREENEQEGGESRPSKIERQKNSNDGQERPVSRGENFDDSDPNVPDNLERLSDTTINSKQFEGHILTLKNSPTIDIDSTGPIVPDSLTRSALDIPTPVAPQGDTSEPPIIDSIPQNLDDTLAFKDTDYTASKFEAQNLRLKNKSSQFGLSQSEESAELIEGIDKSLFFSFYNEMNDDLLPNLDTAEQILYTRLFRLSYGFNRNYCTVSQPVLRDKTGLSRNTIRTGLQTLVKKEWLRIIDAGNHVSTTYRVILPRERKRGSLFDSQNVRLKNGRSKIDPQNLRRKSRRAEIERQDAQKKDLQNLTRNDQKPEIMNKSEDLPTTGSIFEPQKSGTLTITNNILTLSKSARVNSEINDSHNHDSANVLVTLFYTKLGQQPSSAKRAKNLDDCVRLLRDGFSHEQIEYGITWMLSRYPETGSFSRIVHFIDQALKEREIELQASIAQQKRRLAGEEEYQEERRSNEEAKQIESIKTSLAAETLAKLKDEAERLVDREHGVPKYGRETLIQIKLNELIRLRFLNANTQ